MAERNYPSLSTLLPGGNVPEILGTVGESIEDLLDRIRYRNLIVETSPNNDAKFYSLTLITKELAFDLFGSGLKLIFFPAGANDNGTGDEEEGTSEFNVVFGYHWAILKYVPDFEMLSFAGTGKAFLDIFLELVDITEEQFLTGIVECFIDDPAPYQALVDKLHQWQGGGSPLAGLTLANQPVGYNEIEYIVQQMAAANVDVFLSAFEAVVEDVSNIEKSIDNVVTLFRTWLGTISADDIKELLIPQVSASLEAIPVGIQFPSTLLREVDAQGKPVPDPQNQGEDKPTLLTFDVASLDYSTVNGLEFNLAQNLNINFPRSEILKSGLILEVHDVKVDFSRTTNIPEAIADGRPEDFVGVYVTDGTISLPAFWQQDSHSSGVIKAQRALFGTGGASGTFSLEAKDGIDPKPLISCQLGDFSISLDKFSITLKQNAITDSTIEGTLVIPGFKDANGAPAEIRIKVAIRQDGDFDVTAHEDQGFQTIKCGNVFDLTLKSVFFGKKDVDFYVGVSGTIKFTQSLLSGIAPIEIEKLEINGKGRISVEGGRIPLPKNIRFPIGPAELSISAILIGSRQRTNPDGTTRDFTFFGFDGAVDVSPGGLNVSGHGVRFVYPTDLVNVAHDSYLELDSLAIYMVIPGSASKETATLLISGYLNIGGGPDPEYEGGVTFAASKLKITGGASLKLRPKDPAWVLDASLELATPIPIGPCGAGLFGGRILAGQRYLATKHAAGLQETNTWFDYYKVKDPNTQLQGVSVSKLEVPSQTKNYDNPFSVGAGVSLATLQGSGETFSCKLFVLLSLPDLFYAEGKANILGPRVSLADDVDPPFFAMLAISSQSLETGAGVTYKLPRTGNQAGQIVNLSAEMRAAFFFQNSSAWYITLGTEQNPTTAQVLSLFIASSYLKFSAAGIVGGASVTWGFDKSYAGGMVQASVGVYIKVGGAISFRNPQMGGFAMLGGHVDVSLMRFGFHLVIDTSLSVEVPRPFYIQGKVHLCVGVTIGFKKFSKRIEKCFDVEFKWEKETAVDTTPLLPLADVTDPNVPPPLMGTNMLSGESFKIAYLGPSLPSASASAFDQAVLPQDTLINIEFLKGLLPGPAVDARIGRLSGQAPADTADHIPPAEMPHKVTHEYSIKALEIKAWSGNAWVDYRPYEAMSPPAALAALNANPSAYKDGFWQNLGTGFNKICLLAETSLAYMEQGQPGWYVPEQFGITSASLFCLTKLRKTHCIRWTDVALGTPYPADDWRQMETVLFCVAGGSGNVVDWNSLFGIPRSLIFSNEARAQIVFNQPCVEVNLKLTTFSSGAVIRFYKRETVGAGFVYTLVETRTLTQLQLLAPVQYNNLAVTVAKVEIDPLKADAGAVYALQVEIDALYRQLYETQLSAARKQALLKTIQAKEQELARLKEQGCKPTGFDKGALVEAIPRLEAQVKECRKQFSSLQAAQQKVCTEAADLRALFESCFPQTPSRLSYEIEEKKIPGASSGFRFLVYDDLTDGVLLDSITQFPDAAKADSAMRETLELALRPEAYALKTAKGRQYFFQVVDGSGKVRGVNPARFKTAKQRDAFVQQTQAMFRTARSGGEFVLVQRQSGKLPCPESIAHLTCWKQLPAMGAAGKGKCKAIAAGLQSAGEAFCREYNKLYRELYACNKQLLDAAASRCEEMTRELEIKRQECAALSAQLVAVLQYQNLLDKGEGLVPPEGSPCATLLHEACCLSLEDYQFNLSAPGKPAIDQDYQSAIDAIQKELAPIWRRDTKYCIHLRVSDTVNGSASTDSDFYFGFRTAGSLGFFQDDPFANYVIPPKTSDQYLLTNLRGYVDSRRSYPYGELVGEKPLFYKDARILLFFNKRYVYRFFNDWLAYNGLPALTGNALEVLIMDPVADISIPNPPPPQMITTAIPQAVVSWPADDDPRIPEDIRTLLNLHNPELLNPDFVGGECWVSGGKMIKPASVYVQVIPQYLKPLKLYMIVVHNVCGGQRKKVLDYVVQTSRYPDFPAQVKSYRLDDGKGNQRDAIFPIDVALSAAEVDLMYDVVAGNMSLANATLAGTWADPFDRLVAGVMKLKPLDPAISTEFNIVRNSTTSAVIAVWLSGPEAFNSPKIPEDVLQRTLRVMSGSDPDLSYTVLFSKDCAQAFVMHPSRTIPVAQMKFRFAYVEWNGSDYVEHAVVITDAIPTNI